MKLCHRTTSFVFGLCLAALGSTSAQAIAAPDTGPAPASAGSGRVWFLRPFDATSGYVVGAAPEIYANGAPIAALPAGTECFRDFPVGTYRFTVEPYGQPTAAADTVRILPGSETHLQIQWVPTWKEGYPTEGGLDSHSFFVLTTSPQLAQAYLSTLTYLVQR